MITFSKREIQDIIIAWITLSIAFSLTISGSETYAILVSLLLSGSAFVLHELSHKFVGQHFGRAAEFHLWWQGVALGLGMALATYLLLGSHYVFFFAAPGAVYVAPLLGQYYGERVQWRVTKGEGLISLAGPLMNLALGASFKALALLPTPVAPAFAEASSINIFLGFFNMLPVPPLDGSKVLLWNRGVWVAIVLVLLVLLVN